jgi:hypothetical protein
MNYLWPIEKEFLEQNVILGVKRSVDAEVDDPSLPTWNWADVSMDQIYDQ